MGLEIILFLSILALAFFLFSQEIFSLEISALVVLVLLVFSGILEAREAFESFGSEAIILIGSLFVLTASLTKTGIINKIEAQLAWLGRNNRTLSFIMVLSLVAFFSAFVSNTATLAISIPIVVSIARKFGDSPRQWLMPVAFASVLGGMNTLIGTSTNIIISGLLPQYEMPGFDLFTTAYVGLPILAFGLIYLVFFSHILLSKEEDQELDDVQLKYDIRSYTAEVTVSADSPLCNQSIAGTELFREANVLVLGVIRGDQPLLLPRGSLVLLEGDRLIVEGNTDVLTRILDRYGLSFHEQVKKEDEKSKDEQEDIDLYEVVVTGKSLLNSRTPAEVLLRNRYRISLIAIDRQGVKFREKLSNIRILAGDILLVQFIGNVDNNTLDFLGLVPLQQLSRNRFKLKRAPLAASIFIAALLMGSLTAFPIAVTCLAGALLCVITGIIRSDEIYSAIQWRILIFIGAVLCLGKGMEASGTADYIAELLRVLFVSLDPVYALGFFFVFTLVMTQLLSNQATAVVMIPVAINTATVLGLDPMPFIMAVTIAASCCFVTPFEPAFMLVYGPGGYRFSDFFRLGFLLTLISIGLAVVVIPSVWGF